MRPRAAGPYAQAGTGPRARACPKCDAAPGSSCFSWKGPIEFRYKVTLKGCHAERKRTYGAR